MERKEEVALIVKEIMTLRQERHEEEEKNSYSLVGKILSFATLAIGAIFIIGSKFLNSNSLLIQPEYKQAFWMVFLFLTVIAALFLAIDFKKSGIWPFIKDPTGIVLEAMGDNLTSYIVMFQKLDSFSTEAITLTRDELARRSKIGISITGLLVGSLTKVGLLPAIIAILVTASKTGEGSDSIYAYEIFSYMLVGLYFFCFRVGEAVVDFERYSDVLNTYLKERASIIE